MDKLIKPGRIMFAIGIMALGALCIISKDFIVGRPPASTWAADIPGKLSWAYISGSLLILAGLAVIFNVKGRLASLVAGAMILVCSFLLRHLYEMSDWGNAYKALALGGGSFIVAASFFRKDAGSPGNSSANDKLIFTGCIFFFFFLLFADFFISNLQIS